jgi:glycerophosphoryl diester phosphodiesterase
VVENSRAAVEAAADAGYGIEIDIQRAADGEAMVFHDASLDRLTGEAGPLAGRTAAELSRIALRRGGETIPTLAEVLEIVAGRAALLIEVKDQDGGLGPDVGPLERRLGEVLAGYPGPVAVMSFNPHSVAAFAGAAPGVARGLVGCGFGAQHWNLAPECRAALARLADFDRIGAAFVSHDHRDLDNPAVARIRARGLPVLTWTIRSEAEEAAARRVAHNITFERYRPVLPATAGGTAPERIPTMEHTGPRARTGRLEAAWRRRRRPERS